jgi:SAM-dependent methyltransferase
MDRVSRLLSTSTRASQILEIGASYNPTAPKADGWLTHVVDHDGRAGLIAKYTSMNVDVSRIEEVDTIWRDELLHSAVPAALHGRFDTILASHAIEHFPNPVGFLISAQQLLRPDGCVALAIPDRRFCFDYFKPAPTTGDVLEAFHSNRTRHPAHAIWNMHAYSVLADGVYAWGQHRIKQWQFMFDFANAAEAFRPNVALDQGEYEDCHAWHFTPASFSLIMLELGQLGIVDWHIDALHETEGNEFFAFLRRGADRQSDMAAFNSRRLDLLRRTLVEARDQLDYVWGRSLPREVASLAKKATRRLGRIARSRLQRDKP